MEPYSGVVQWQDRSFWSCLSGFESLPRSLFSNLETLVFVRGGYNRRMDPEYFRTEEQISTEEQITLTSGEWQELVSSLQNLVQANNALLQTVSELMAQRSEALAPKTPIPPASGFPPPLSPSDPYDLAALNRLLAE